LPENISEQFRQFVGVDAFDGGYIPRVELADIAKNLTDLGLLPHREGWLDEAENPY
jgi:hypothetical protein